jgi:plastocyanin
MSKRRTNLLPLLALAVLVFPGLSCGGEEETSAGGGSGEAIEITATDFAFAPNAVDVDEAGTYTFRLVNDGNSTHALEIEGGGAEAATAEVAPGASAEVTIALEPGSYELYCPVGDHRELGMEGTITVGGGAGGGSTTTGEDDSGGYDYSY